MLTVQEIQILIPLIDAGIKATGVQIFQGNRGVHLQVALNKLQQMAEQAAAADPKVAPAAVPEAIPNGGAAPSPTDGEADALVE